MSDLKPCHCGDPYEQHVLTESGTYCVLCARRALERIGPLEAAVRKVCDEMKARGMAPDGDYWTDIACDKLREWAAALERAMEKKE